GATGEANDDKGSVLGGCVVWDKSARVAGRPETEWHAGTLALSRRRKCLTICHLRQHTQCATTPCNVAGWPADLAGCLARTRAISGCTPGTGTSSRRRWPPPASASAQAERAGAAEVGFAKALDPVAEAMRQRQEQPVVRHAGELQRTAHAEVEPLADQNERN